MNDNLARAEQPGGKSQYVFVYGTLKEGYGNHNHYLKGKAGFISSGRTKEKFKMFNTGFPVVIDYLSRDNRVAGEIYAVDDSIIRGLDQLEGNGRMYIRGYHDIELEDGSVLPCWMYTGVRGCWENCDLMEPVTADDHGLLNWRRE
jgi:gamma-glutamylcyclotransferase (GGCT)/AIG2-like uncharacterized protein YtfP